MIDLAPSRDLRDLLSRSGIGIGSDRSDTRIVIAVSSEPGIGISRTNNGVSIHIVGFLSNTRIGIDKSDLQN